MKVYLLINHVSELLNKLMCEENEATICYFIITTFEYDHATLVKNLASVLHFDSSSGIE